MWLRDSNRRNEHYQWSLRLSINMTNDCTQSGNRGAGTGAWTDCECWDGCDRVWMMIGQMLGLWQRCRPHSWQPRMWRRWRRRCEIVSRSLTLSFRLHRIYGFGEMKWNKLHLHCMNYRSYRSTVASSDVLSTRVTRVVWVSETLELYFWTRILEHLTTVKSANFYKFLFVSIFKLSC